MKLLFIAFTCICTSLFAQQKEKKIIPSEKDSAEINKSDPDRTKLETQQCHQKNRYKMPVAKPADTVYSRIKNKNRDTMDYKILNSVKPEENK